MEDEQELFDEQLLVGRSIAMHGVADGFIIDKIDRSTDVLTVTRSSDGLSVDFDNIDYIFESAELNESDDLEDELCRYGEVNRLGLGDRRDED